MATRAELREIRQSLETVIKGAVTREHGWGNSRVVIEVDEERSVVSLEVRSWSEYTFGEYRRCLNPDAVATTRIALARWCAKRSMVVRWEQVDDHTFLVIPEATQWVGAPHSSDILDGQVGIF